MEVASWRVPASSSANAADTSSSMALQTTVTVDSTTSTVVAHVPAKVNPTRSGSSSRS